MVPLVEVVTGVSVLFADTDLCPHWYECGCRLVLEWSLQEWSIGEPSIHAMELADIANNRL